MVETYYTFPSFVKLNLDQGCHQIPGLGIATAGADRVCLRSGLCERRAGLYGGEHQRKPRGLVAPSRPLSFLDPFSVFLWWFPFDPLKVKNF